MISSSSCDDASVEPPPTCAQQARAEPAAGRLHEGAVLRDGEESGDLRAQALCEAAEAQSLWSGVKANSQSLAYDAVNVKLIVFIR